LPRVLTVFGTRPEAIKLAPLVKKLEATPGFESVVCVTGQHRQMLDQVMGTFGIRPDQDLDIMRPNQDLTDVAVAVLAGIRGVLQTVQPHIVLVQGDTTTAFAASVAAFYNRIPVGHVEAGLRTFNKYSPFPEEGNRCMTSAIAELHFAPTAWAAQNLINEGVPRSRVFVTGNTVVDALVQAVSMIEKGAGLQEIERLLPFPAGERRIVLITGHRRESFGEGFRSICRAIRRLVEAFPDCDFVYPVHLNPNVRAPVNEILHQPFLRNIQLVEPLGYLPFVCLMKRAYLILTDSGGIQEEALTFRKPILVMRDTTERPEGVESGGVRLVGNCEDAIFGECSRLLADRASYDAMVVSHNPYGDGRASDRIVETLKKALAAPSTRPIAIQSRPSGAPTATLDA
jgi:UDP-N-acetylglucosamine 2-epimerase (non-hydrolysing)